MAVALGAVARRRHGRAARRGRQGGRPRSSTVAHRRRVHARSSLLAACALAVALVPALETSGSLAAGETVLQPGGETVLQQKLTAAGEAPEGLLGRSAALSADGSTLVVGAPKDSGGAVYVYSREGSTWKQQAKLTPGEIASGEGACQLGGCPGEEC